MPHIIMKLADEPIILVHISGAVTAQEHFKLSLDVANLIEAIPGRVYRINDLTDAQPRLMDMVDIVVQITKGWYGTASDPRVVSLATIDHGNVFLGMGFLIQKWRGAQQIHLCTNVTEALARARALIAAQAEGMVRVMA